MGYKQDKKTWRNREPAKDERHWTTQRREAVHNNDEGDWPSETGDKGTRCALCKSPINRYGFCSNRQCKYGR